MRQANDSYNIFTAGNRVRFSRSFDHWEAVTGASIAAGEVGAILDVDPESGDLFVRLDAHHQHLDPWHNGVPVPAAYRSVVERVDV